ncbi:hypothetical protein [Paraeggerthella sp.]|uniref:hypothetical protein n=1 Tax=Paraeggerthella sp. TaxID=2897350 RepID=UPI00352846C8
MWTLADIGVDQAEVVEVEPRTRVLRYREKPARQGGRIVEGETTAEVVRAHDGFAG